MRDENVKKKKNYKINQEDAYFTIFLIQSKFGPVYTQSLKHWQEGIYSIIRNSTLQYHQHRWLRTLQF